MKYNRLIPELSELLEYNPENGHLIWNPPTKGRRVKGNVAGFVGSDGNRLIAYKGVHVPYGKVCLYKATGKIPDHVIHIDGDKTNFKLQNIASAPFAITHLLRKAVSKAPLPKGIVFHKSTGRYTARIQRKDRTIHVGTFENLDLAVKEREKVLMRLISTL